MSNFIIAIDGPAASGKSTISKLIAKRLGIVHIDTGSMYRAATLKALELNIDLEVEQNYHFLDTTSISYRDGKIYLDGRDVSKMIRTEEVTKKVSLVSSFPYVRKKLVEIQQGIKDQDLVVDGRDIGTVVFPNADVKIFLTANVDERVKRRLEEIREKGEHIDYEILKQDMINRDEKDSTRKEAPLIVAEDAKTIDSTSLTKEQVAEKIINIITLKRGNK